MAMAFARSVLYRATIRGASRTSVAPQRSFASKAHLDDAHESAKWEKITYLGIAACTALALLNLSKGHPHFDEPPAFEYLHIRNKEFPWGPDGLFEVKDH